MVTKVDPTSPDIDVFGPGSHGACWGGGTGDPVALDGELTLGDVVFWVENLAARVEKNVPTLAPHPLKRSLARIAAASTPAGAGAAWVGGVVVSALPSGISELEITMPELVLLIYTWHLISLNRA